MYEMAFEQVEAATLTLKLASPQENLPKFQSI